MGTKDQIKWQLQTIRQFDEQFFPALKSPADWTHQVFPGSNHALWVVGHLAMVDNNVLGKLFPEKSIPKHGWSEKFGRQSKPSANAADYPPPDEVLAFFRDRRTSLLESIDQMSEADLEKPVPPPAPPFIQNARQMFAFLSIHEGIHMGQLSMCRRALGNPPIV
jgi:hypothetical protein